MAHVAVLRLGSSLRRRSHGRLGSGTARRGAAHLGEHDGGRSASWRVSCRRHGAAAVAPAPAKRGCARRGRSCEPKARETIRNTRANMGSGMRPKGNGGEGYCCRRRRELPTESSFSGEELLRLRDELEMGQRGELEREAVVLWGRKQQAIQWR